MADVTYIPDANNGNQMNNWLPWMLAGNGGFFGGLNSITDLFGLAIVAQMFGFGNYGGGIGGGGNAAGFISNQLNNDSGRALIMNAVTSQGEASRAATQNLATMIGQDFNLVNSAVSSIQNAISSLALQQAVSVPQLMNSILSGNQSILTKLGECCCENRLLTTQQGYEAQIRTLEQTNALGSQADRNTRSITDAIAAQSIMINDKFCDLEKRELQGTITRQAETITQLRNEADNARQTNALAAMLAPIAQEVNDIKCKLPSTATVQYPNLVAFSTTPNIGGFYGGFNGYGYGPGWGNGSYWG